MVTDEIWPLLNALYPIDVTEFGIFSDFMAPGQEINVEISLEYSTPSIDVKWQLSGSTFIASNELQPSNTSSPIVVTDLGIDMEVSFSQSIKAQSLIVLTEFGMSIDMRAIQSRKASELISVTELGIVIDVSALHSSKALLPIVVTEFGMVTDVKSLQR